jgi:hypothetical protein
MNLSRETVGSRDGGMGSRDGSTGVKYTHAPPMPPMSQAQINRKAILSASPLDGLAGGLGGMI